MLAKCQRVMAAIGVIAVTFPSAGSLRAQSRATAPPGWAFRDPAPASSQPRILIIYDMEGLAGIDRYEMTICGADSAAYREGQAHLVADVNAVIDGVVAGGASEVGVIDRHGGCDNPRLDLPADQLDKRARFVDESKSSALDQPWDGVALVGMHAGPGVGGFLEHIGSFGIERILNGLSVTESEQFALRLGEQGIPVIFASGDDRLRQHMSQRMPWVRVVEVKRATSRVSAVLRPVGDVRADLRAQAQLALEQRATTRSLALLAPFSGAFRPVYPASLEPLAVLPGVDIRSGMIPVTGNSARELNQAINRVQTMVASFWWAEMFWEAAKDHPDIVSKADALHHARWVAGPPAAKAPPP